MQYRFLLSYGYNLQHQVLNGKLRILQLLCKMGLSKPMERNDQIANFAEKNETVSLLCTSV